MQKYPQLLYGNKTINKSYQGTKKFITAKPSFLGSRIMLIEHATGVAVYLVLAIICVSAARIESTPRGLCCGAHKKPFCVNFFVSRSTRLEKADTYSMMGAKTTQTRG